MNEIEISLLADHPEWFGVVACWHHAQWRSLHPGETLASREASLRADCGRSGVPITVVAHRNGAALGSASLIAHDMDSHPERMPWLASVYVEATARGEGIGQRLVRRIEAEARASGIARLHLFTPDRAAFYAALGWREVCREHYHDECVTVMERDL